MSLSALKSRLTIRAKLFAAFALHAEQLGRKREAGQGIFRQAADDGSGFDLDGIRRDRASLGILGMEERVSLAGGTLTGSGTSVRAQIPATGAA